MNHRARRKWPQEMRPRPETLDEIREFENSFTDAEAIERAEDCLGELCATGTRSWQMRIPVDARTDTDYVIGLGLRVADRLLRDREESRRKIARDLLRRANESINESENYLTALRSIQQMLEAEAAQ